MVNLARLRRMDQVNQLKIAWLLPVAWFYWQPALSEFTKRFPKTTVYTALFPGFARGFEDSLNIEVVGQFKLIGTSLNEAGYGSGITYLSPSIVSYLIQLRPRVIFTSSFGIWTILALLLKPLFQWRVILAYEGSAPGVDYRNSAARLFVRRRMVQAADAYITNSQAGRDYFTQVLNAKESRVFAKPYEVPAAKTLLAIDDKGRDLDVLQFQRPVFLFVGRIMPRKGLRLLLQACTILQGQGYQNYTLLIVGDGSQKEELEVFSQSHNLENCVQWVGKVDYNRVNAYFRCADVFVLPTLEDTWGVVVLEVMLFGKPVLCSLGAGAAELVIDGENGYVFDPYQPKQLAERMRHLIDHPSLISDMGQKSKQMIADYTPEAASEFLTHVTEFVLSQETSMT